MTGERYWPCWRIDFAKMALRRVAGSGGVATDGVAEAGHAEMRGAVAGGDLLHGLEFVVGGFEGGFQAGDLAEPAFAAGLVDAVLEVVADFQQPGLLGRIRPELRAPDA